MGLRYKKSPSGKWIKVKIGKEWKKILAPAFEKERKIFFELQKEILRPLEFKIEERKAKTIPKSLSILGISDKNFALPTRALLAHSSPIYPGVVLLFVYDGLSWFSVFLLRGREVGKFVLEQIKRSYSDAANIFVITGDISRAKEKIREFWGVPKIEREKPKTKMELKEKLKEEKIIEKKGKPKIEKKKARKRKKKRVKKEIDKTLEKKLKETFEFPPLEEMIEKVEKFEPKDALSKMAKIRFEAILAGLRDEELKERLYKIFYPITVNPANSREFFRKLGEFERKVKFI